MIKSFIRTVVNEGSHSLLSAKAGAGTDKGKGGVLAAAGSEAGLYSFNPDPHFQLDVGKVYSGMI